MFLRYNILSKKFEYDGSDGLGAGPWIEIPVAYVDRTNIFTQDQTLNKAIPIININNSSSPIDSRKFRLLNANQEFYIQAISDDETLSPGLIKTDRAGNFSATGNISERNRTAPLGEWIPFTPQWISDGAQPSGGGRVGRYTLIGKTCHYWSTYSFDSGTNFGTGFWYFPLPIPAFNPGYNVVLGSCRISDVSTEIRTGVALYTSNGALILVDRLGYAGASSPHIWAAGDALDIQGTYEIT